MKTLFKKSTRLTLRPLAPFDHINWQQAYTNMHAALNRWDESPWRDSELTEKKFKTLLKEQQKMAQLDQAYHFGVFLNDDGQLIGFVDLMNVSRGAFQNAYIGYRIFNPYWGYGFAQEAIQLAHEIAFKKLKLHRLEAGIAPDNKASIKVAKKCGYRKEGLSKKRLLVHKKWEDMLIFAQTIEDFKETTTKKK